MVPLSEAKKSSRRLSHITSRIAFCEPKRQVYLCYYSYVKGWSGNQTVQNPPSPHHALDSRSISTSTSTLPVLHHSTPYKPRISTPAHHTNDVSPLTVTTSFVP
eukprot:scaffold858_cov193-Alexandrium_tamarense.AAC.7